MGVELSEWRRESRQADRLSRSRWRGAGEIPVQWMAGPRLHERAFRPLPAVAAIILLTALSGCGSSPTRHAAVPPSISPAQQREYAPPGTAEDPWGAYIREASQRYQLPEQYIRAVMRQESGGQEFLHGQPITSPAGAIGLMQVMPETYANLRDRYGLGPDPYNPRDNILAGTAYLKELYDRFGSPGFLAAYNCGPRCLSDHLASGRPLPAETLTYVAAIGPRIGASGSIPSGTGARYAMAASSTETDALNRQALASAASGRAYAPTAPVITYTAPVYTAPVRPPPPAPVQVAARPAPAPTPPAPVYAAPAAAPVLVAAAASGNGGWGIQVGAFSSQNQAQAYADTVRAHAHGRLDTTRTVVPVTMRPDGAILYRARLVGLTADAASDVCNSLAHDQMSCIVVAEDRV
jgi:D-alanyl-D-alanine carboxypeptidase